MALGDLLDRLGEAVGWSSATTELVGALLALLFIVLGVVILLVALFGKWATAVDAGESRLLPTLAEDVLDHDLRRVYERTLLVDALVSEHFSRLADATGTEFGRRVRKFIIRLQAGRFAAAQNKKRGEPSHMEARLEEVDAVVKDAVDKLGAKVGSSSSSDEAARLLDELLDRV